MNRPLISVVLPVYNGADYLEKSIISVLNQTMSDFELLIMDDSSTDNSLEIISKFDDSRIKLFKNKTNKGIFFSINRLIEKTNAELIHLWAQDDIMLENCLEHCVSFHQKNKEVAFSFSSNYRIDEFENIIRKGPDDGKEIVVEPEDATNLFLMFGCIPSNISSVTIQKIILINEGLFNDRLKFLGDFSMWVKLASKYSFGKISKRLVKIRTHNEQASRKLDMLIIKVSESAELYRYQLSLLEIDNRRAGERIIRKIHHPHFIYVAFGLLKKGHVASLKRYLKQLQKLSSIGSLFYYFILFDFNKRFGLLKKYKSNLYKPFQSSIDKFY